MKNICIFLIILCTGFSATAKKGFSVAVNMIPGQQRYFTDSISRPFARQNRCDIDVIDFKENDELVSIMNTVPRNPDGGKYQPLGLVMIPHQMATSFIAQEKLQPLNDIVSSDEINSIKETFFLVEMFEQNEKTWLIPRKLETRIMVYRKSKVDEAIQKAAMFKDSIDAMLKQVNGFGLPRGYQLERSPDLWDFFDLFVAGYFWAHHPDNSTKQGKIAHRGKKYHGTVTGLVDKIFQCDGTRDDILDFSSDAALDAFSWEAVMIQQGLYNEKMWTEGWSGTDIWQAFKDNEIFLSFMTQIDCFFLIGGENMTDPYIPPDDFGIAVMPSGCSLAFSDTGAVARTGRHAVSTGGWWWGIPKQAKREKLVYEFLDHCTSLDVQQKECGKFGMIPVRMEMIINPADYFEQQLVQKIFTVSKYQITNNSINSVPLVSNYQELERIYLDAWYTLCVDAFSTAVQPPSTENIGSLLEQKYGDALGAVR
jgi:ABC-type glycerol-3-phosphate transport system substrate-binding protein